MTLIQAIIYGLIQGLTEFLPVSSSAHLALFPWFFGWADPGLAFDVALHWGTLAAVLVYFRRDIVDLTIGWLGSLQGKREPVNILPWHIILATIPGAAFGFLFEKKAETIFRSPLLIATMLAAAGIVLFIADKIKTSRIELSQFGWGKSLLVGLSQALAVIPGVSRSGITTTTGLFLSLNREAAVRFSFLLSIPIIMGAGLVKIKYFLQNLNNPFFWVGLGCSAVSGLLAIHFLINYVKKRNFTAFVVYRIILATVIVAWFFMRPR